ncbi:MAG: nitrous oxide reductase family maturation protein NosD [Flavobacteriales bacterium]|nr:nitrous oxide reductase family maturation protein NosD [Flavobacteriales bacterium]
MAFGRTIDVCASCDHPSLASAVEASIDGDSILVHSGTYIVQELIIEKAITILGEGTAVLDGDGKTILYVHHDNVQLLDLTFQHVATNYVEDRASVKCNNSDNLLLRRLRVRSSFFGLLLEKCNDGIVEDCDILGDATSESYLESANGNAIHLWYCKRMTIRRNTVRKHRDGIYFEFVENTDIRDNRSVENMRYGLHFMFSHENIYTNNTFEKNGAGVAVMYSDHVTMAGNRFLDNWGTSAYGLLLKDITDSHLEGNTFRNNTIAISADNSSRITMRNNRFEKNGYALRIMGNCTDNVIVANDFIANSFDVTTNSSTNYNAFDGNYWEEYTGYDLDRNGIGDVPFRPVKLFTYIIAQSPASIILMRSTFIDLLNLAEKVTPVLTPETLVDQTPVMHLINDHLTSRT